MTIDACHTLMKGIRSAKDELKTRRTIEKRRLRFYPKKFFLLCVPTSRRVMMSDWAEIDCVFLSRVLKYRNDMIELVRRVFVDRKMDRNRRRDAGQQYVTAGRVPKVESGDNRCKRRC